MIHINSQGGRIGQLWWLNTDPSPVPSERLFNGAVAGRRFVRWGTAGIGTNFRMNHPMQPTPQQFGEWLAEACALHPTGRPGDIAGHVARRAYAAGADAELEACDEWVLNQGLPGYKLDLRDARRPAPTPQQRALAAIGAALAAGRLTPDEYSAISEAMGGLEIVNA